LIISISWKEEIRNQPKEILIILKEEIVIIKTSEYCGRRRTKGYQTEVDQKPAERDDGRRTGGDD
jgi:hypothetical protein